jgi:hypothetical protein
MTLIQRWRARLQWPVDLMVGLFAFTVIAWLILRNWPIGSELDKEVVKALPQVGIVTVAGALLTFLASEADRRRADFRSRQEPLQAVLNRVTTSYNNTKRARRNARARGLNPGATGERIDLNAYDECMADVNDAQLEFETIEDEINASHETFPSARTIVDCLHTMEEYLSDMIKEYERERRTARGKPDIAVSSLPAFSDFVASAKVSQFKEGYSRPCRIIREAISRDILNIALGARR